MSGLLDVGHALNVAGALGIVAVALLAVLTTPSRAQVRQLRELVGDLQRRLNALEDDLHEERERRIAAERAAAAATARVEELGRYAAPAAFKRLAAVLDRIDQRLAREGV